MFSFDQRAKRYRGAGGRFLPYSKILELRDLFLDGQKGKASELAGRLARGERSVQEWELAMRREVKTTYLAQYMLGRGGRNSMTSADFGRVGAQLKKQYGFLHEFAADVKAGRLSEKQITARAELYFSSAVQSYERGRTAAHGSLTLPAYPGDGTTECRSNDRCSWRIEDTEDDWRATWTLSSAEHCPTCRDRASTWNPLVIPKGERSTKQEPKMKRYDVELVQDLAPSAVVRIHVNRNETPEIDASGKVN